MTKSKTRANAIRNGWRSGLEEKVGDELKAKGVSFGYESDKIKWTDHKIRTYTPDFFLPNGIIIETKGRFTAADRRKHLEIQKQHPDQDIRFVFDNAKNKLYKGAKSTYADWCDKNGFKWAEKSIPEAWLNE